MVSASMDLNQVRLSIKSGRRGGRVSFVVIVVASYCWGLWAQQKSFVIIVSDSKGLFVCSFCPKTRGRRLVHGRSARKKHEVWRRNCGRFRIVVASFGRVFLGTQKKFRNNSNRVKSAACLQFLPPKQKEDVTSRAALL
ncbi:hypothetical protein CDAR_535941 [Caerostris darwini]|uniref:Uncharacterized protein n=1 Tax=Caerostris darwini TaxID=1538125 RepID=A0AAV4QTH0_9ARAC|nr:hypothetical protein CDAR_535941 [Caerostris darwini]